MGNTALPPYVKYMAAGMLGATFLAALVYAVWFYASTPNGTMPTMITAILFAGLTYALNALGMHQGASLSETIPPAVTVTNPPTVSSTAPATPAPAAAAAPAPAYPPAAGA